MVSLGFEIVGFHLRFFLSRWVSLRCSHRVLGFAWTGFFPIKVGGWQGLQGFERAQGQHPSNPLAGHGRSSRTATNQGCGRTPRASSCLYSKHKLRTGDTELPRALECLRLYTTPTWSLSTTCWSSNHLQKVQQKFWKNQVDGKRPRWQDWQWNALVKICFMKTIMLCGECRLHKLPTVRRVHVHSSDRGDFWT